MNNQKGFSAIHVVILLALIGAMILGYVFYQKNEVKKLNAESYNQLTILATRFDDKMNVAQSIPRIGLGAVLNDLATIKSEVAAVEVSDCYRPAKAYLSTYAEANLAFMSDFAAKRIDESNPESYQMYMDKTSSAKADFTKSMEDCQI